MIIISVAIGAHYELEVQRLIKSLGLPVNVLTTESANYLKINDDPLIDGLYHKANFANCFDDLDPNTPILFCDADLFALKANPLQDFIVDDNVDFAFVPYSGTYHFPDLIRQDAFDAFGYKINSGFMYFKNLLIAQDICTKWAAAYLQRVALYDTASNVSKFEYDEYALMIALLGHTYTIQLLDRKWNDFDLNTPDEIHKSDSVFFQSHDLEIG
jgi:hypothetical protein